MNEDNLNNTNPVPDVNSSTNSSSDTVVNQEVTASQATTVADVKNTEAVPANDTVVNSDSNVNIINAENIIGEAAKIADEVVPREEMAKIDTEATQNIAVANLNPKEVVEQTEKKPSAFQEKMKQAEANYKPPSKFKMFILIVFFILLIAFVLYLPTINSMVIRYKNGDFNEVSQEEITSGKLICDLSTSDENLDYNYTDEFTFKDGKLKKTKLTKIIRGDITLDEATLDDMAKKCELIAANAKNINGATIKCDYTDGKLTERQTFDLEVLDVEQITSAFSEAGGQYLTYRYDQDIDEIEKEMYASRFECKKEAE